MGTLRAGLTAIGLAVSLITPACGEKFSGVDDTPSAGTGGSSAGEGDAGDDAGGKSSSGGRAGAGGKASGGQAGDTVVGGSPPLAGGPPVAGSPPLGGSAGAGGGPIVEPPPVPQEGLELWLRVDEGVEHQDGVVTTWKDSSGKGRDALQTAVNYRPKLAQALGGKPGLSFDGVDDFLKLPALDTDFSGGVSVVVVLQQETSDACNPYFEASNGSEIDDLHFGNWNNAYIYEVVGSYLNDTNYPLQLAQAQIGVAIQEAGGLVHLRRNSNGVGEASFLSPSVITREQVFIGRSLYASCVPFKGAIGELLLYSRALDDQEVVDVESYLQDKWGCCTE
jgi:hypothetical protein